MWTGSTPCLTSSCDLTLLCNCKNHLCSSQFSLISCEAWMVSIPPSSLSSQPFFFFSSALSSAPHKHEFICVHMRTCFELLSARWRNKNKHVLEGLGGKAACHTRQSLELRTSFLSKTLEAWSKTGFYPVMCFGVCSSDVAMSQPNTQCVINFLYLSVCLREEKGRKNTNDEQSWKMCAD